MPNGKKEPRRESKSAEMPAVIGGEYLLEALFDIGPVSSGGMGSAIAISELELSAWQINRGIKLTPWECDTIKSLSREYAGMLHEAKEPTCQSPWVPPMEIIAQRRAEIAKSMQAWADQMATKK